VPNLAAEARGLARAQAALTEGNAAQALTLLDQQKAQFPDGALDEERAAARVLALCRMGQVQAAGAAAAEFLRRSPRSVLAERVANACPHQK
jgi:outer membrane protein assembly factor BamD (BamD/ComL family)